MRSPAEYEAEHAAGDPDGLARAGSSAGAREKAVHNSEDALAAFGFGLSECTTDPGRVSVSKDGSSGPGRRVRLKGGAGRARAPHGSPGGGRFGRSCPDRTLLATSASSLFCPPA